MAPSAPAGNRGLVVAIMAISQIDDIYTFHCNGDWLGDECPHVPDWEPGETSGLEDVLGAVTEHIKAHADKKG